LSNEKWLNTRFSKSEENKAFQKMFFDAVEAGKFEISQPKWQDIIIGGYRLHAD
jgi:hypothetical protein